MNTAQVTSDRTLWAFLTLGLVALVATAAMGLLGWPSDRAAAEPSLALSIRIAVASVTPFALFRAAGGTLDNPRQLLLLAAATAACALPLPGMVVIPLAIAATLAAKLDGQVSESGRNAPFWTSVILLILAGAVLRMLTFDEPFERDLMVYATVAQSWLDGARLYADVWDHKPPALYVVYAAAIGLFGQSPLAIYALGVSAFALTLVGIGLVARRLAGPAAGLCAVLIWAVTGTDPLLQANQPNVEVFMNACLVWALWALITADGSLPSWKNVVFAGGLFLIGSAFKQVMVFPAILVGLAMMYQGGRLSRVRDGLLRTLVMGAIGAIGWIAIGIAFYLSGTFDDFIYGAFGYNQSYSGSLVANLVEVFTEQHPVFYVAAFVGVLAFHMRALNDTRHLLLVAMALGAALMVAAPGQFFPHYYQLLLPFLAIGGGWIASLMFPGASIWVAGLLALMPVWVAFGYMTSPERVAFVKYGAFAHGGEAADSQSLGRWLASAGYDMADVLHVGAEPGIYFWSGQSTPYKYVFHYPLFHGARQDDMAAEFIRQASCQNPELVIVGSQPWRPGAEKVYAFLDRYFVETDAPKEAGGFKFMVPGPEAPVCQ